MTDKQMTELKQFIVVTVSRSEASIEKSTDVKLDVLRQEMHDGFAGVAETVDQLISYSEWRFASKPRWLRGKFGKA